MRDKILEELKQNQLNSFKGWRVTYQNQILVMQSGKFMWEEKSHAKNALINHLKRSLHARGKELHDSLNKLIEENIVEFNYFGKI